MKTTGGRDTFLFMIVLLLAIGSICYLFVIKKSLAKLKQAEVDLQVVEQEKAEKDAIIEQGKKLNAEKEKLEADIAKLEDKFLPSLNSDVITRKLYKYFEDAGLKYYVNVENSEKAYETVTMQDGTANKNRAEYSSYTVQVSGTDGFFLTHDEAKAYDDASADSEVTLTDAFAEQRIIGVGDEKIVNQSLGKMGIGGNVTDLTSKEYVGYKEFVKALEDIQNSAQGYVKITDINIADQGQGFCYYTAVVNVYSYNLVKRISTTDLSNMEYMKWVGADNIARGGLVGLPNYFSVINGYVDLPDGHPLKDRYLSFVNFDFSIDRPFAAWNMWSYEWQTLEEIIKKYADSEAPSILQLRLDLAMGKITTQEFDQIMLELTKQQMQQQQQAGGNTNDANAAT